MNWFVHEREKTIREEWDHCEHLKEGDVATHVIGEQDSFGPLSRTGLCEACYKEHKAREDEELEYCHDCGEEKPRKEVLPWRWYDFYAPQGDEPLMICTECRVKPKHLNRVKRDNENYEDELNGSW